MLKNTLIMLTASLPFLGYSDDSTDCLLPPEPIESCQLPVGYFYPAQYTFGGCLDLSIAGEFIYWEVNRDSFNVLATKIDVSNNGLDQNQTPIAHHQGYRPGFKIGLGMGLPGCDNWEFDAEYTWFHHKSTTTANASVDGYIMVSLLQLFFNPDLAFFQASSFKSELKFDLDFLQTTVGKSFYLSQRLIVDADFGLKSWWSSLNNDLFYTLPNGNQGTQRTKSGLWGIGPYVKAQIKGLLWCGTYLFGEAGIWPTYTRVNKFRVKNDFPAFASPFGPLPPYPLEERNATFYYSTQLFYEGGVGLGWGTYFCDCGYHVDLLVAYEMMSTFIRAYAGTTGNPHREFYYQGLTVKAQLDF